MTPENPTQVFSGSGVCHGLRRPALRLSSHTAIRTAIRASSYMAIRWRGQKALIDYSAKREGKSIQKLLEGIIMPTLEERYGIEFDQ